MPLRRTLRSWLRRDAVAPRSTIDTETVVHAQGQCLVLIATMMEKKRLLAAADVARALGEFAAVTSTDRPDRARLLQLWASYVAEAAANLEPLPDSPRTDGVD